MGAGSQFLLLLWKNWLIQKRKVVLTLFEVGVPTLFALILVLIRQRVESTTYDSPSTWNDFSVDEFDMTFFPPPPPGDWVIPPRWWRPTWGLAYAPETEVTKRIASRVAQDLGMHLETPGKNLAFSTEEEMVKYLTADNVTNTGVLGGIVFSGGIADGGNNLTQNIQYKIRLRAGQFANVGRNRIRLLITSDWYTELMFPLRPAIGPRSNNSRGGTPNYAREGFLQLQRAIDSSIIEEIGGAKAKERAKKVEVRLKRFPYPPFINDPFILVIQQQFPFIILLSFIITAPNIVKDVVLEKERKLKESMKMMGLSSWLHWLAWFIKYLMFLLIAVIIMTILFCTKLGKGSILTASDGSLVFVFLVLYSISIISFCFAISTFFSKANSGAAAGGILFLFSYIPYFFLAQRYSTLSFGAKMATCLFNNVAMAFGCLQISLYEGTGVGMQWSNFYKPVNIDDNFTMAYVFLMLIADTLFYALVTWYVDAVFPGEFGIAKPLYFPFTKKYWCGSVSGKVYNADVELQQRDNPSDLFEKPGTNLKVGISFQNLRKEFKRGGQKKVAVSDINLEMFEGQITALLGHNGAGKTTTISMLTGFLPTTSGTAYVNGFDIETDIDKVRSSLGLCPQHDVLFDTLTVEEHLKFFAKLKGCSARIVEEEVTRMIKLLHLDSKTDVQAQGLSGGMKRKLSVGIALIGGSKVVILDEPTSGMDPEARRLIWDILQSERSGRTMVLTTHYMDEADLLGDRIAIMSDGIIQCCGTSLFLKNKYGVGYHMSMVKDPKCDVSAVSEIIKRYVPDAAMESNISAELSFVLPHESSSKFEELFSFLETHKKEIGILSYGASVTTMEEVFLKVGESNDDTLHERLQNGTRVNEQGYDNAAQNHTSEETADTHAHEEKPNVTFTSNGLVNEAGSWHPETKHKNDRNMLYTRSSSIPETLPPVFGAAFQRNAGVKLYLQQFRGLFVKRMIHSWRNKIVSLTQLLVPIFFTIIGCVILKTLPSGTADPYPLSLNMNSFSDQIALYQSNSTPDTSGVTDQLKESYRDYMTNVEKGVGQVMSTNDVENSVLNLGMDEYNRDYLVAAMFEGQEPDSNFTTKVTAYFNNQAYHTIAISLSMIGNAMMRLLTGESEYTLEAINHPLPRTTESKLQQDTATQLTVAFAVSYNIMFGMAFLVGTFAVFLIKERSVKSKHIQYVSGVHTTTYWFSTFAWDIINYLIPASLLLVLFVAFQVDAFIADNNLGYVFLLLLLYGWAVLPFIYLLSHLFSVPATGYVWITVLNIFTGTAAVLAILILKIPQLETEDVATALEWVFYILLPNFAFGSSLQDFFINYESKRACTKDEIPWEEFCAFVKIMNSTNGCCRESCGENCIRWEENIFAFTSPGIGRACLFLGIHGFVFMALIFFMEAGLVKRFWQHVVEGANAADDVGTEIDSVQDLTLSEDDDVAKERERIQSVPLTTLTETDSLILSEIKKYYGNFLAVDRLSVGIPQGECFGLLGVNGAGKTTTFKMMTGDESLSAGDALLDGFSVKKNIKEVQQRLGYCPQFDALIEQMTVVETLRMYARLRGVDEESIPGVIDKLVNGLLLKDHAQKQAGDLSGGNKRKLSTAIALVGDPPIIFLDEPTTGMDPVARRLLWDTLTHVRASGRTLVLTSHSMEECEALCTRLAVMVNGQFKCLGSTQHLKTKFGEGYTLIAKVSGTKETEIDVRTSALRNFIEITFPSYTLKDLHQGLVHYQIYGENLTWSRLFGTMERAKAEYNIEDYSVSQTTLEQVFINFARNQQPPFISQIGCMTKLGSCCSFLCRCCKQ